VIDFRLYRLAFLPAALAFVAVMFSLEGAPRAIEPGPLVGSFEGDRATSLAREIVALAPEPDAGSDDDARIADLVGQRFGEIGAGATTEQSFEAEVDGDTTDLRNVILTLPGVSDRTVVVLAGRDSPEGPGAASSAAATGVLLELADTLGERDHDRTYVLASTSGDAWGAAGASALIEALPQRGSIEAVVVISQPGPVAPRPPYVVATATGEASAPVQLVRTAELAVRSQALRSDGSESPFTQLSRLALPSGIGAQAPLIADGLDAVAISAAGERPLPPADDSADSLSGESIDAFGRAVQSTISAIDLHPEALEEDPGAHIEISGNLIPGWAVAALALALILPAALAAVDACARAARGGAGPLSGIGWAAARSLPFVGALGMLYALALVGLVPRPPFPFDPRLFELGGRGLAVLALILLGAGASAWALRAQRVTGAAAPAAALAGLGVVAALGCLLAWLANPYLALLLAPTAHAWLLGAGDPSPGRAAAVAAGAVLACLPLAAAVVAVTRALGLGADAPWTFTLMVADGQIGLAVSLAACFIGGALLGSVARATAAARHRPAAD